MGSGATAGSLVAVCCLALCCLSCETDGGKRFGDPCAEDTDCESNVCFESTCGRFGLQCDPGTSIGWEVCNDGDVCTSETCGTAGRCIHTQVEGCSPGKTCKCADAGATIDPGECTWNDAAECSGWHSVLMENDYEGDPVLPDGTTLCAFGCCLTLRCP